ncbi:putative ATP/GTP-binding protein [Alphaentomopoxvirus acuprea]|uniref:DNA packaging protein OPG160 n=1 Tax=Alphaentomopoxvirus acuprea TaxID=62099 RepID=W6JL06_9POXV|nr:putative ATP/GTP-binding protein [Anomala cuprea entomopoxvirus]BAO49495.1 putative ATP/GTP-binding protein [Anomala cuprea entomopoxvirus]
MIIEKIDYDKIISTPFNMAILGKTGSGKTTFLKNFLIETREKFDFIYLVTRSKTCYDSNNYHHYIYPNHVLYLDQKDNFNSSDIKAKLSIFLDNIKKFSFICLEQNDKCNTLVIFDDVGRETKDKLSNFTNECRHSRISNIFLVHRLEHIDKTTRDSISLYVINSPNINLEYLEINKSIKTMINTSILNAFSEYNKERGLFLIIQDSKVYSLVINDSTIKTINESARNVLYTNSIIKQYIT